MLRMAAFGKTGVGKSTTLNSILGRNCFASACLGSSVTQSCQEEHAIVLGRSISVVDTPGMFDTSGSIDMKSEIRNCFELSKQGLNVVLLIARIERCTQEDFDALKEVANYFGDSLNNYTIMLFTHYDDWKRDHGSVDSFSKYIETLPANFRRFIEINCHNRYLAFDNTLNGNKAEQQIRQLFLKIDELLEANGHSYFKYNESVHREQQEENARRQELQVFQESPSSESTADVLMTIGNIIYNGVWFFLLLNGYGDTGGNGFYVAQTGFVYRGGF